MRTDSQPPTIRRLMIAAIAVSLAIEPVDAGVLVVDQAGGPGFDHTTLGAALGAAQNGDAVLIRSGTYDEGVLSIIGKALNISAEASAVVDLGGSTLSISNLLPNQTCSIRGVNGGGLWFLTNNQGSIWIEDCDVQSGLYNFPASLVVSQSSNVTLTRCNIEGTAVDDALGDTAASHAITSTDSTLWIFESDLIGGSGITGTASPDVPGGHGVFLSGGQAQLYASAAQGGSGGTSPGGSGAFLGGGASLYLLDEGIQGGAGTPTGAPIENQAGTVVHQPWDSHSFEVESPKRYGQTVKLSFVGHPGEQVFILKQVVPTALFVPNLGGPVLIDPSIAHFQFIANLPASGQLDLTVPIPTLSFVYIPQFIQPVYVQANGKLNFGSGSFLQLLNNSF